MEATICDECEEFRAQYKCTECEEVLCEDCADDDHGCIESKIDELREKMFKEIKQKKE